MEHQFWHERWEQNQIGFHQSEINAYLNSHWAELGIPNDAPVFVPLCGKSLDMLWLREQGHALLGIDISDVALQAFFNENQLPSTISTNDRFTEYSTDGIKLLGGDFFALTREDLGEIRAVYDRAALIALPPDMRKDYVRHMEKLLPAGARILLITLEYPDGMLKGPPFSVAQSEVESLYQEGFEVTFKGRWDGLGPKGKPLKEVVYTLQRKP